MPFDVLLAPYESSTHSEPNAQELLSFADSYIDADDPERNYPILLTDEATLAELMPWDGNHPKHCVLSPEREIVWCEHGNGLMDVARDFVLDEWSAR